MRTENRNNNNVHNVYYKAGRTADVLDPDGVTPKGNSGFEMGTGF